MYFFAFSNLINGFVAVIFGLLVYLKNPKGLVNKTFGLMNFGLAIWCFSYWGWLSVDNADMALFWSRLLNFGATLIPIFYLHWVLSLLNLEKKKKKILTSGYLITFIFLIFSFTPWYIKSVGPILFFPYWPQAGPLYICYLVVGWIGLLGYGFYQLLKAKKTTFGYKRTQIQYIVLGSIVGLGGGATNFPLMFGVSLFPPFGVPLVIFYPLIFAYAIVKYRLMDIRFVLGKGAVYGSSLITIIAFASLLIFLSNQFLITIPFNVTAILVLIVSVLLFQPIFRFFESFASKYFYYTFYSYQTVITDLSKRLTQVLDMDKLSSLIVSTLMNTMKLDRTVILLREAENEDYQIQKNIGFKEENGISLVKDNFLTTWLERIQKPLVYEELSLIARDTADREEKEKLEKLRENMKRIEAALCLPLLMEGKVIGMIVLGNKISGDPYSEQDIDLLTNLSNQASIALQNAKLYDRIQDLSQNLQEKVDDQTKELREAYEELKKLDRAKSEFISIASHQLRTPLTAIKGYISMMIEESYGKPPEKMQKPLENIYTSNERLIKLVNDLLSVSRIESGRIEIKLEKVSIDKTIFSLIEELKGLAQEKNLYLRFEKPEKPLPEISADEERIRQVILNLIDNAIRYTNKGGITVKLKIENLKLKIIIEDTGEGISKEEIPYLFESFSRGTAGARFWTEGAGLGLYVAKKFVEMHNGKIWAESPGRGKGSTFYIELKIS